MIVYKETRDISKENLLALYTDAGWSAYTENLEKLKRAFLNSNLVVTAWQNDILVGLIRTVGDNETICYIQDILILKAYMRNGIGKHLINIVLEKSKDIRQIVLLADAQDIDVRKFYESQNFSSCDAGELVAFTKK